MKKSIQPLVIFRVDASIHIGSGHIMRCLTLASHLAKLGYDCRFICRPHPGNLIGYLEAKGFSVFLLPLVDCSVTGSHGQGHASWLGCSQEEDAAQCLAILTTLNPTWLFVDHYAIDMVWEEIVGGACDHLAVIDDLADRKHICDLLIDANLGRRSLDYERLSSTYSHLLIGPKYAMLRDEFADLREFSLERRSTFELKKVMIAMGGIDLPGATLKILHSLSTMNSLIALEIDVVMGCNAPSLSDVQKKAASMPFPTTVSVGVSDMADRMANSDLAIGAAGGTAWERCCLGLPSIVVVLAENQWPGAKALDGNGSALLLGETSDIIDKLPYFIETMCNSSQLALLSKNSRDLVDGRGVSRIVETMESYRE